ncbi:NAD(P)-dependent oxidoreductase [Ilyomonas limi]|uniref:NAD(P)-dependent oxidoreductase n=1 Tax=Ilyomonas limi TaxID=2575867 RepID=A0A4U3L1H9_9BACT|nr:NAD(P)-dependent oxidoreductase [Ilyomonas limi]TKK68064.1 NAD(P)-dependent oxidoreductase [Ilyomonas limi]
MLFTNKTIFITGASRGIGKAIALRLAAEGANIVIAAKSIVENEKLGGTIYTAAKEMEAAGGQALPVQMDIRFEEQIDNSVSQVVQAFGGIDILVNNASAIQLSNTEQTEAKRFYLMHDINVRGTFMMTKACIPYLKQSAHAHILTLSPPIDLQPKWLGPYVAYTISKYSMSMMALGWAAEFKKYGIASNALWPTTTIDTAAVRNLLGGEQLAAMSRKPEIVADAAFEILSKSPAACTGNTFLDEAVLRNAGITDFDKYAVTPGGKLYPDLYV